MKLSVRGALVWSFAERYTSLVITVASTMILARLLTPQQVGVFSLCAAAVTIAGILRDFGVSEYLVQEKELDQHKLRNAFGVAILLGWGVGALIFSVRGVLADYYQEPLVKDVLSVLTLNFLLLPLASPAFALLTRELAFRKIFVIQTVCNAAQAASAVSLALLGFGTLALAWAPVISIALQILMVTWARPKQTFLLPSLRGASAVFKYGGTFALTRVIETTSRNTHEFMIARHLGFASVGLFSRALGLLEIFYNNFTAAILRVFTPLLSEDRRQGRSIPQRFAETTTLLTSLAWPILSFIAIFAHDIIGTLFGSQWLPAAPSASLLAISSMLSYATVLGPTVLLTTGHIAMRLRFTVIVATCHITTVTIVSRYGLEAVAGAFVLSSVVGPSLYLRSLPSLLGCTRGELFSGVGASLRLGLICAVTLGLTSYGLHHMAMHPLVKLVAGGLVAAVTWMLAARWLRHPIVEWLPGPVGRLMRRPQAITSRHTQVVAYVIQELGAVSETFIADEILSVRTAGASPLIFYGRVSASEATHENYRRLRHDVQCFAMADVRKRHELAALCQWLIRDPVNTLRVLFENVRQRNLRWIYFATLGPALQARARGVTRFHAHFADVNALHAQAMAKWCRVPFSMTAHRYDIFEPTLARDVLAALLDEARPLVTISKFNQAFIASRYGVPRSTIAIVHCGVDLGRFEHRFRPRMVDPSVRFTLLSVGRLVSEKAFNVLLDAARLLKDRGRPFRLLIAGTGPCEGSLREQVETLALKEEVQFLGAQPTEAIIRLHREADAFVSSSLSEGLPVACIEALALGSPTVATAVTGVPELVRHEETGLLAPPASPAALAEAIMRYMDDESLRENVSRAGRQWVESEFERAECTRQLLEVWAADQAVPRVSSLPGSGTCCTS